MKGHMSSRDNQDISYSARPISTNLEKWCLIVRVTYPWSHMTLWSRIHVRSRYKLKTKRLFFGKVYVHQTWQNSDLWKGEPTHQVNWLSDHVVIRVHMTS